MAEQQKGTFFFSILDTRKVKRLSLEGSNLTSVNLVILATAVSSVEKCSLSRTILNTDQVREILKKCVASKSLKYFSIDNVEVPEDLLKKDADDVLGQLYKCYNIKVSERKFHS